LYEIQLVVALRHNKVFMFTWMSLYLHIIRTRDRLRVWVRLMLMLKLGEIV